MKPPTTAKAMTGIDTARTRTRPRIFILISCMAWRPCRQAAAQRHLAALRAALARPSERHQRLASHCSGSTGRPSMRTSKYRAAPPDGASPTCPSGVPRLTFVPRTHGRIQQVAVQRERRIAVIDDHQRPESAERRRIGHGAFVHGRRGRPLGRRHLDAISDDGGAETAGGLASESRRRRRRRSATADRP